MGSINSILIALASSTLIYSYLTYHTHKKRLLPFGRDPFLCGVIESLPRGN